MRRALWAAMALSVFGCAVGAVPAHAQALEDTNPYAEDVQRAERALDRARTRLASATEDAESLHATLPQAESRAGLLADAATRRQAPAASAASRLEEAERRVRESRRRAAEAVTAAQTRQAREIRRWRQSRATWVGIAAAMAAIACAAIAAVAIAHARTRPTGNQDRVADVVGLAVGFGVAAYLSGLLAAMLWADTWIASWWLIAAAALGAAALIAAVAAAWNHPTPFTRAHQRLGRAAAPAAILACALAIAPAATAGTRAAPLPRQLDHTTLRLAEQHKARAPMPPPVQALRARADRLNDRAARAQRKAGAARGHADGLASQHLAAQDRADRAERSITYWTSKLQIAQADYDDYQDLFDSADEEPRLDEDADTADLDDPLDDEDPLDDDDYNYTPRTSPTTEDFGSGSGRVGLCRDGTLSDSIGRPGACSHHGGVAGG